MALRNAFDAIATETTLAAVLARLAGVLDVAGVDSAGVIRRLRTDTAGRMKISHGVPDAVTVDLTTTGTGAGAVAAMPLAGFGFAAFYFYGAAHAGYSVTFEQSPDSTNGTDGTWFATLAVNINSTTTVSNTTGVLTSNSSTAYEVAAPGATYVRARVTARTSGTLTCRITGSTVGFDPAPSVPTISTVTTVGRLQASSAGTGFSATKVVSAESTNSTLVKNTAGNIYGFTLTNVGTTTRYVKFYNSATAPVVGTTAVVAVHALMPGQTTTICSPIPLYVHSAGIGYSITNSVADSDIVAVGANEIVGSIWWL